MKKSIMLIAMAIFLTLPIAASAGETNVYGKIQSFTWEEYKDGVRLLKESGPMYGIGVASKLYPYKQLTAKIRGEIFGSTVDYEGQTWAGVPFTTNTAYLGLRLEGDVGWKFPVDERTSLEPFAGLGYRWWSRDIQSRANVMGYIERWQSLYARLGARGDYDISRTAKMFAEAGLILPLHNENKADLPLGIGPVTLNPGKNTSVFAELGVRFELLQVSVYYEGLRFSKSDPVSIAHMPGVSVWQPESKADMFGLRVGVAF